MTVHQIITGQQNEGQIEKPIVAGHAFRDEKNNHYALKFRMFPGITYFLRQNKDSKDSYTIFAKHFRKGETVLLKSPVGSGKLLSNLKSHMELRFPLLSAKLFMDLYPVGRID